MKKITLVLSAIALLFTGNISAQDASASGTIDMDQAANTPEMYANARAAAYAEALGLNEKETFQLAKIFVEGESGVVELRQQCIAIQAQVEETMGKYDTQAEQLLTKEQQAKLEVMKKGGTWKPGVASCAPTGAKAGCAGHGAEGKAAGCCAGKAGAHATGAAKPATPAPNATMR